MLLSPHPAIPGVAQPAPHCHLPADHPPPRPAPPQVSSRQVAVVSCLGDPSRRVGEGPQSLQGDLGGVGVWGKEDYRCPPTGVNSDTLRR